MSLVLAVHFKNSIYEYFLPGLNNRKISVEIPAVTTGCSADIDLAFEVWNGVWQINETESLHISKDKAAMSTAKLEKDVTLVCQHKQTGEKFSIIISENYGGYSDFDKYVLTPGQVTIGSANNNTIQYNIRNLVSGHHATIETDSNGISTLIDTSSNGTHVNGRRIGKSYTLHYGDVIYIIGLKIVYLGNILAINNPNNPVRLNGFAKHYTQKDETAPDDDTDVFYQRSPRLIKKLDDEQIDIEAPPNPNRSRRQPLIFTIGPSMTMVIPMATGVLFTMWSSQQAGSGMTSPFMFMGIITSVTAAAIGVSWALANYRYSKKLEVEDEARRSDMYRKYLDKIRRLLSQKHEDNKRILDNKYPSAMEYLGFTKTGNRRLWERNVNHLDFLTVKLGQGEIESPNVVTVPKERFSLIDDTLADEPQKIKDEYNKLRNAPVCISLKEHRLIGVIGSGQSICTEIAQTMAAQLAAYHSYTDVRMAFIYNEAEANAFEFARWLPHTWSADGSLRLLACDANGVGELFYYFSTVIRERTEEHEGSPEKSRPLPHYIIFITDPSLVENEAAIKHISAPSEQMGISTVLVYGEIGKLPNDCTVIIQNDNDYRGYYSLDSSFDEFENVAFDTVPENRLVDFSRKLSDVRVRETQSAGAIPELLTFLDMYKISKIEDMNILRRWLENRTYESMKAMIGYRGTDTPLYLDIHEKYHGPHGLVAGTTGSGKSETLQTYILSLALNYHPYEISFILIDYKGGGMAGSFEKLPHVAGIITNLGGNQTNRALASINSEIKRRQSVLNEFKLKHIDGYIELYRAGKTEMPMPHLLIIADEFAELKKEQPEFVRELVSASRVGRSLGVHLILATQKPSGVVDDEIWGNAKFRLCLRVQDKQDSNEMIKRPDAAYITNAGRGYFQVGSDEIFEAFQSGWSGAKYEPELEFSDSIRDKAKMISLSGRPRIIGGTRKAATQNDEKNKVTQLEAAVIYIHNTAVSQGIKAIDNIWLPPLPKQLSLHDLREYTQNAFSAGVWQDFIGELNPFVGIVDDPVNQRQIPLTINLLNEGHLLIAGSSSSGKTTFLQTLLYSLVTTYSPKRVNAYIADFGSRTMGVFGALPHIGGVVYDSDADKADKLISMLMKELNRRKLVFSQKGIGSIREYARLYDDVPFVILAIDNFAAFSENCPKQEDNLIKLSQEAASYGIYLVITCTNINDVRSKIRQNITYGVGLQLSDRFEYEEAIRSKTDITAEDHMPGRGLVCYPKPLEFQTALCFTDADALSVNTRLKAQFDEMSAAWEGTTAPGIPQIPEDMSFNHFLQIPEVKSILKTSRYMPLGFELTEAQAVGIDLARTFCYTIGGSSRSGKTNLLKTLMRTAKIQGGTVCVFDGVARELAAYSDEINADKYMTSADELFEFMKTVIVPEFACRNALKAKFIQGGRRNIDAYIESEPKIFIFIGDMTAFCEAVYMSENNMSGFLEQMVARGEGHMIYLFACVSQNDMTGDYGTKRFLRGFVSYKDGIHFGGKLDEQKVFDFDVPVLERGKKLPVGYGHTTVGGITERVVAPSVD